MNNQNQITHIKHLNKAGTRWQEICADGKSRKVEVFYPRTKHVVKYAVAYIEQVGNFAHAVVKIGGKLTPLMEYGSQLFMINNAENRLFAVNTAFEV